MNDEKMISYELPHRPDTFVSADLLKMLAMGIMLIDHIGAFLVDQSAPVYLPLRSIGRLAFPIFCYLIAEGAHYTRSVPKYLARLAAFAIISTPPYNLVQGSAWYSPENINVFFTLFFGLAAIYSITGLPKSVYRRMGKFKLAESKPACALLGMPLCVMCYFAAYIMHTDYGEYGVAAILLFYLLRRRPVTAWLAFAALTFVFFDVYIVSANLTGVVEYSRVNAYNVVTKMLLGHHTELFFYNATQMFASLAFVPCLLYNGKKGRFSGRCSQYFFYAFYPVHLFCLWFVQLAMGVSS